MFLLLFFTDYKFEEANDKNGQNGMRSLYDYAKGP